LQTHSFGNNIGINTTLGTVASLLEEEGFATKFPTTDSIIMSRMDPVPHTFLKMKGSVEIHTRCKNKCMRKGEMATCNETVPSPCVCCFMLTLDVRFCMYVMCFASSDVLSGTCILLPSDCEKILEKEA
jgi:hypothetical protein